MTSKVCQNDETEDGERKLVSKGSSVGDLIMGRETESHRVQQSALKPSAVIESEDLIRQQTKNA